MKQPDIDYWIRQMLASRARISDLNITAGKPLQVEADGVMAPVLVDPEVSELTPFQAEVFALNLMRGDKRLLNELVLHGSCDMSYWVDAKTRFRVNVFSQKNRLSAVLRLLETRLPTIDGLNLPDVFHGMPNLKNGLVLFTGATGTGKTTSLAAILEEINTSQAVHVVALEDPIEYVHPHKKATFSQRELGVDFDTFANGLRAALRQAPKVILVGEMRDRETLEIALTAAETGHLVFSTLHTVDAGQSINRILGMFDKDEQAQTRNRLVDTLRWVVGQRLLPRVDAGRVAAFEIMGMNLRLADLIVNGESEGKTFYEVIASSTPMGWQTFDQAILHLYEEGLVSEETALRYCSRRSVLSRGLDQLKAARGEATTGITGLAMEKKKQHDDFY